MTPTRSHCRTRAPKASGSPELFAGTSCDPYTHPRAHTSYIRSWFAGPPKLGVAQALAGALGVPFTQSGACMSQFR